MNLPVTLALLLFSLVLAPLAPAQTALAQQNAPPPTPPPTRPHNVTPGQQHTNNDHVKVDNFTASHGDATIDPKDGTGTITTTVRTRTGFQGAISGLDSDDTVAIGSNNTNTKVEGEGGATITQGGGSRVEYKNTSATMDLTVTLSSGNSVIVPPGQRVIVQT